MLRTSKTTPPPPSSSSSSSSFSGKERSSKSAPKSNKEIAERWERSRLYLVNKKTGSSKLYLSGSIIIYNIQAWGSPFVSLSRHDRDRETVSKYREATIFFMVLIESLDLDSFKIVGFDSRESLEKFKKVSLDVSRSPGLIILLKMTILSLNYTFFKFWT